MAVRVAMGVAMRRARRLGLGDRVARSQWSTLEPTLVGEDRPPVTSEFRVLLLQSLPRLGRPSQRRHVLPVAVVGAAPGLRHLLGRRGGSGPGSGLSPAGTGPPGLSSTAPRP